MNIQNRWFQLVASLISMVMIANLQSSWTLFVQPMQTGTGWKLADIHLAFSLFILFQTWIQPLDGWLIDRLGPRGFISAAGVLCGLGWAGMGYASSLPMLYALYCLAGMGAAFVYSASIGSALKWFKDRRGLASAQTLDRDQSVKQLDLLLVGHAPGRDVRQRGRHHRRSPF